MKPSLRWTFAVLLVAAVLATGLIGPGWYARRLTSSIDREARQMAGPKYEVTVASTGLATTFDDSWRASFDLPAYRASNIVTVRSSECTSFAQRIEAERWFGPGGRRLAFLSYVGGIGNPDVLAACRLADQGAGPWLEDGRVDEQRLLEIGSTHSLSATDLAWVEFGRWDARTGQLLGFDDMTGQWHLLAQR